MDSLLSFVSRNKKHQFYQPVILSPGVIEVKGLWHSATLELSDIILEQIDGKSILDLGCNVGYFLIEAMRRGANDATGVDHDKSVIKLAQEIRSLVDIEYDIVFDDVVKYVPKKTHDIICLLNVLEFIHNPQECFNKLVNYFSCTMFIEHKKSLNLDIPSEISVSIKKIARAGGRNLTILTKPIK